MRPIFTRKKRDKFQILYAERASLVSDPRTYVMIPFLATTVAAALMAVYVILNKNAGTTTLMVNCNIALWLVNLSYFIAYDQNSHSRHFRTENMRHNWKNAYGHLTTLHCIMLSLLFITIVGCGHRLRSNSVRWPSCNFLKLFTISGAFTIAKLVIITLTMPLTMNIFGSGFQPLVSSNPEYCSNDECGRIGFTAFLFFSTAGAVCFLVVLAVENFFSVLWGKVDHRMIIPVELLTGIVCLIIYVNFSPIMVYMNYGARTEYQHVFVVLACVCLMHGWLLWWSPEFISSSPSVIILIGRGCKNENTVNNTDDTSNVENSNCLESDEEENSNSSIVTRSDDEAPVILPLNEHSTAESIRNECALFQKSIGICISCNSFIFIIALASLIICGLIIGFDLHTVPWPYYVLVAVVSATAVRAIVTIMSVSITKHVPIATDLQSLLRLGLETALILFTSVALLVYYASPISGGLALSLVFFKLLDIGVVLMVFGQSRSSH